MGRVFRGALLCLLLASLLAAKPLFASGAAEPPAAPAAPVAVGSLPPAAAPPAPAPASRRELGGHTYLPFQLLRDPFIITSLGSATGLGYSSYSGTLTPADGSAAQTFDLRLLAYAQTFTFQVAVARPVLLRLSLSGLSAVPLNLDTVYQSFTYGLQLAGSFGGVVAIPIGSRLRLGLSADVEYTPTGVLDLAGPIRYAVEHFQQQGTQPTYDQFIAVLQEAPSRLLRLRGVLNVPISLLAAVTLHRALGAVVNLGYAYALGNDFITGDSLRTSSITFGLGLSADLGAVSALKLGVLLAYRVDQPFAEGAGANHQLSAGLFYTGRHNLALGLDNVVTLRNPGPDLRNLSYLGNLVLRYFW